MSFPLLNVRFILLISASFVAIFSSIAIYFCLPILISHVIRTQITLGANSGSWNDWRTNSVIDRIYLYNITNLNDLFSDTALASGATKPVVKLKQLGPFAFRQDREKLNIIVSDQNETVLYDQKKSWTFLPELSAIKSLDELNSSWVNHMNVPLAGTTMNPEYAEFIDPIVSEHDLKLFSNHSILTLLFEGYYDILMEQAKASGQIDVDRFGWLHNQNNSLTRSVRIFTGTSNATLDKFGSVDELQFRKRFSIWRNNNSEPNDFASSRCNDFRLSSAGEFFPPSEYSIISYTKQYLNHLRSEQIIDQNDPDNYVEMKGAAASGVESASTWPPSGGALVADQSTTSTESPIKTETVSAQSDRRKLFKIEQKVGQTVSLFMPDLCRTIRLHYNGSYHYKRDLLVDRYVANELTFNYDASTDSGAANQCYCIYNEATRLVSCPPNGMMDLFSCRKGSPISISFPHFLYSTRDKSLEPYLRLFQDEIEPNLAEHQFFIDLEATLNVPVNVQTVFQFNVHFRNDPSMNFTREYVSLFEDPATQRQLKDLYLPQMWIKSTAEIDEKNLANLRFIQKHLDLVTPVTTIVMFGCASVLLMAAAKLAYDLTYGPNSSASRKVSSGDHESCSPLNSTFDCQYLDEKQKYFNMQSMQMAASNGSGACNSKDKNGCQLSKSFEHVNNVVDYKFCAKNKSNLEVAAPGTSKGADNSDCLLDESRPLNRQ